MQGRCASSMPPPPRRTSYPRQCRVAYTPARDTVVLHHLWKPSYTGVSGAPPAYSQSGPPGSSLGGSGLKPSPYMQLYGPPPSYESVIGAGPAPIHNLAAGNSGHFDQTANGSAQLNAEGTNQNLQLSSTVNMPGSQQHFKSPHVGQHHRRLSVGASGVAHHDLTNSGSCHVNVDGLNQEIQTAPGGSGHQHYKAGHHHRPLSLGASGNHFDSPSSGSNNHSGTSPDLLLTLSVAGSGHQHFKSGHHHRQLSAGHNTTNHHPHGEYTQPRQSSAHIHHYHQHHAHHRQSSQPVALDRTLTQGVAEGSQPTRQVAQCEFVPPPPLQDDEIEWEQRAKGEQSSVSLPPPGTPVSHSLSTPPTSVPQQP